MISPKKIAIDVALRMLQLQGSNQSQLETSYTTGLATLDGKQVPASALKYGIIAVEAEIYEVIANDLLHPYRAALESDSEELATGDSIPYLDADNKEFIGMFSGIIDADDGFPLNEGTLQEITRFLRARGTRYNTDIRFYKLDGGRIFHTRTSVKFRGCAFDFDTALARFGNTEQSPLPSTAYTLWVARSLEFMAQEGWFIPEASYYGNFARDCVNRLKKRDTNMPQLPTKINTATPVPS